MTEVMKTIPTWKATERIIERTVETVREPEYLESGMESTLESHFPSLPKVIEVPKTKLDIALEWLLAHPEDMNRPTREVAERLNISHAWIGKARRILRGEETDDQ